VGFVGEFHRFAAVIAAHLGEIAALAAAGLWAVSARLFRHSGHRLPPLPLNLCKNALALVLLALTAPLSGASRGHLDPEPLILLTISGMIGIGIGDSAFFAALNRIGERRCLLLVETLAPIFTTGIAYLWLQERLSPPVMLAIGLVLAGIFWAWSDDARPATPGGGGWIFALSAALCQAIGTVLSRQALTASDVPVLWSTMVRLGGGLSLIALILLGRRQTFQVSRETFSSPLFGKIALATLLGTYLGIFLQQLALKHADAGIVQTLLASSSVLVIPLAVLSGERVGLRAWGGALLAFAGIFLLFRN